MLPAEAAAARHPIACDLDLPIMGTPTFGGSRNEQVEFPMVGFRVPGMTCSGCVRRIRSAVQGVDPQAGLRIDLEHREIAIESTAGTAALANALRNAGYEAEPLPR